MAIEDRTTLKGYFEDGDIPTGAEFENLIDSAANLSVSASNTFAGDVTVDGDLVISTGSVADDITNLAAASGGWSSAETTVNSNSASWVNPSHLPKFVDHSVNLAKSFIDHEGSLVLESSYANPSLAGNYNGGGTGSKPIASIGGYDDMPLSAFPVIDSEVEIRTDETIVDPQEDELGVSYNALVDLGGVGSGPYIVLVITKTLNQETDKYGNDGAAASITDFDINDFSYGGGGTFPAGPYDMENEMYVVVNMPGSGTGNASPGGNPTWFENPVSLDIILSGGTMPGTGYTFTPAYPDAKLVSMISTDGGHPAGTKLAAIQAQLGSSGNDFRVVTAITELSLDGVPVIPIL